MKNYHFRSFFPASLVFALLLPAANVMANPADFTVTASTSDATFSLAKAKGSYVVIHFLLKTECPICLKHTRSHLETTGKLPGVVQIFLKPDTEAEIKTWTERLSKADAASLPIYRDPEANLAGEFKIPNGYKFHGQTVHFPATVLLGPDGKELFRYVGKNNSDRLSPEALAAKIAEFRKS